MATQYRVYVQDTTNPVPDYTTPYATVSGLSYTYGPPGPSGQIWFGVRTYDTVTGLEERNVDASLYYLDAVAGFTDVPARPVPPVGTTVDVQAAGAARVRWSYLRRPGGTDPTGFYVYKTVGGSVDFASSPVATIPFIAGQIFYKTTLSSIAHATTYAVGVRAYNAAGTDLNETSVTIVGDTTAPGPVEGLAATPTYGDAP